VAHCAGGSGRNGSRGVAHCFYIQNSTLPRGFSPRGFLCKLLSMTGLSRSMNETKEEASSDRSVGVLRFGAWRNETDRPFFWNVPRLHAE
jgi:hypothetical protein